MKTRSRSGFSLLELLVILAIFAILLGLLLPAVQKVREAASRMSSANNMKQIALACLNYESANAVFPTGVDDNHFSAAARFLPYIEQNNLYNQIDFKKPVTDEANAAARKVAIKTFLNPGDSDAQGTEFGPTNYLFNAGSKFDLSENNGVFFLNSKVRIADITDGTSNTLMTGETLRGDGGKQAIDMRRQYVELDKDALKGLTQDSGVEEWKNSKNIAGNRCSSWMDGRFLQGTFTGTRVANDERPDVDCAGSGGLSGLRSFPGRPAQIGMCDGSVRALMKNISLEMWGALAGRNDGHVIPNDIF